MVVAGPLESQIYPDLEGAGIPFERLDLVGTIIDRRRDPSAWWAMRRLLAEGDFDAAHAHGVKAGTLLRTAGPTVHVPVLYTPHLFALISNEHRDDIPHPRLRHAAVLSAERGLGLLTARLVCVSEFERGFANRLHIVPARRRRTIPNGVSLDRPPEPDPELVRWRGEGPLFGTVSVLRWEKGLRHLVDVAVILNERGSDVKLAIVGDGPERADLKRRIERAGVGERLRLFPFSGSSDPHLAALDGLVLPSDVFESLPIGVIEAMAHSVPVIASNLGGVLSLSNPGSPASWFPRGTLDIWWKRSRARRESASRRRDGTRGSPARGDRLQPRGDDRCARARVPRGLRRCLGSSADPERPCRVGGLLASQEPGAGPVAASRKPRAAVWKLPLAAIAACLTVATTHRPERRRWMVTEICSAEAFSMCPLTVIRFFRLSSLITRSMFGDNGRELAVADGVGEVVVG